MPSASPTSTLPTEANITLLHERLHALLARASDTPRLPALERLLARGRPVRMACATADELRGQLFGLPAGHQPAVGALTRYADSGRRPGADEYWLRVEVVSLRADMARVLVLGQGLDDCDAVEQQDIRATVAATLAANDLQLHCDHPQRWTLQTPHAPGFDFPSIDEALGCDMADVLPAHAAARPWRHLLNEIQIDLHACDTNRRRRERGQAELNSVWFWGGGVLPRLPQAARYRQLISSQPVSRGLAGLQDIASRSEYFPGGENAATAGPDQPDLAVEPSPNADINLDLSGSTALPLLLDITPQRAAPMDELLRLERLVGAVFDAAGRRHLPLCLLGGDGSGWQVSHGDLRRFWKISRPLGQPGAAGRGGRH